jgi:alanine dehydrogenase
MALLLTEQDVIQLFPMECALERVEASFRAQHGGRAANRPRERIFLPHLSFHYMAAAIPEENILGMKVYTVTRGAFRFVVLLFDAEGGDLLALIEADHLGRIRTGAASGVATKFMARENAAQVGLIGTGRQARTQLEAVAAVRKLAQVKVFSRSEEHRRKFSHETSEKLGVKVEPTESAEAAARFGDIVITATNASQPVIQGKWLRPGTHLNVIGANVVNRREVDERTLELADTIAVDSLEQARKEAGDLIQGLNGQTQSWNDVVELHEIVCGGRAGRKSADEITLFKSCGIALWDVAAAGYIYRRAVAQGKGKEIEFCL